MKRALIYSLVFHVAVLIVLMVGFSNPFRKTLAEQRPIMIEFVNISDFTQAPVIAPQDVQEPEMLEEAPQQEPAPTPPVEAPKPEPLPAPEPPKPTPPPPPKPEPKPESKPEPISEPEAEPIPTLEPKKPEPKPEPKPEKKPEVKEEPKKKEDPKKEKEKVELDLDKTKEKPKPKKDDKSDKEKIDKAFDDLFKDLNDDKKDKKTNSKSSGGKKGAPADRVGDVVTASEIDAIKAKMREIWIVPNGARGAKNLRIKVSLKLSRDATVLDVKIVETNRLSDPVYKAAAESAERAIRDPRFSPVPLNLEKYEQWKEIILNFDPKDMY